METNNNSILQKAKFMALKQLITKAKMMALYLLMFAAAAVTAGRIDLLNTIESIALGALGLMILNALIATVLDKTLPKLSANTSKSPTQMLGPFLCRPTKQSMSFWFCSGNSKLTDFKAEVRGNGKTLRGKGKLISERFNTWIATVEGLEPGIDYQYSILSDQGEIKIPWQDQLKFSTPKNDEKARLLSLSCHGIEAWEHKHGDANTWNMWNEVLAEIKKAKIDLAVLGGDQVYMDDQFEDRIEGFKKALTDTEKTQLIMDVYFKYWGNSTYQSIFAQTPSVLMWDDHDLIDGFGSREDSYALTTNELKDDWETFKAHLSQAFFAFQACRNPETDSERLNYTFKLEHDHFELIGLDLRSERNSRKELMISKESKPAIAELITSSKKTLFILSPVTLTRIGDGVEQLMGELATSAWNSWRYLGYGPQFSKVIAWLILFFFSFIPLQVTDPTTSLAFSSLVLSIMSILYLYKILRSPSVEKAFHRIVLGGLVGTMFVIGARGLSKYFEFSQIGDYYLNYQKFIADDFVNLEKFAISILLASLFFYIATSKMFKSLKWPKIIIMIIGGLLSASSLIAFFWYGLADENLDWNLLIKVPLWLISFLLLLMTFLESARIIDYVSGLDDDIKDSWSSSANRKELSWLLNNLKELKQSVVLLCGDIHTGGYSNIILKNKKIIPQITSSPITYETMPTLVEKITTGAKSVDLPADEKVATAENVFFIAKRNFSIIEINASKEMQVEFNFEDQNVPIRLDIIT